VAFSFNMFNLGGGSPKEKEPDPGVTTRKGLEENQAPPGQGLKAKRDGRSGGEKGSSRQPSSTDDAFREEPGKKPPSPAGGEKAGSCGSRQVKKAAATYEDEKNQKNSVGNKEFIEARKTPRRGKRK